MQGMRVKEKPLIYWRGDYKEWWCSAAHMAHRSPLGCGPTPKAAYVSWFAKRKAV